MVIGYEVKMYADIESIRRSQIKIAEAAEQQVVATRALVEVVDRLGNILANYLDGEGYDGFDSGLAYEDHPLPPDPVHPEDSGAQSVTEPGEESTS